MKDSHLGIAFSLGAFFLWSLSPFFFTTTGRRIGPFATNMMRLVVGFPILLLAFVLQAALTRGALPGMQSWILLSLSGVLGLAIGDHFLYTALTEAGPERVSLLMTISPAVAALLAWFFLKETLTPAQLGGMILVLGGVLGSIWPVAKPDGIRTPAKGTWNGIAAALCQSGGTILARQAFLREETLSPVFATTLRVGAAAILLVLVARWRGALGSMVRSTREPFVARRLLAGTLAGPVGGMFCYVAALKYQPAGIVTTIIFMTPLLIIPLGAWRYGTKLSDRILLGGAVALAGVAVLGWEA